MPYNDQVEISSDDSSSSDGDNDVLRSQQLNDEPALELSEEGNSPCLTYSPCLFTDYSAIFG